MSESPHPAFDLLADHYPRFRDAPLFRHRDSGLCFVVSVAGTYESMAFRVVNEGERPDMAEWACSRPADVADTLQQVDDHLTGPPDWVWDEDGKCPHCVGAEYPEWALADDR